MHIFYWCGVFEPRLWEIYVCRERPPVDEKSFAPNEREWIVPGTVELE